MGLSQHERTAHSVVRNEARAKVGTLRGRPPPQQGERTIFSDEEIDLMLQLEVKFHGDRCMAKRMSDFLPNKTSKQLRDKRALPSYKALRDEYVLRHLPQRQEADDPTQAAIVLRQDDEQKEVAPPLADTEAGEGLPQPSPESTDPEIPVEATEDSAPPEEANWRLGIIEHCLAHELPQRIPAELASAIELMRGALRAALELNGKVPQADIDHTYEEATAHQARGGENGEERHRKRVRGKRRRRVYIYAQTQDLYKKNPGLLAKHVRNQVDWLDEDVKPKAANVRELYGDLWAHQPAIQLPEMGQGNEAPLDPEECCEAAAV